MIKFIAEKIKKNWELILACFLWLCIWGTYNTDIFKIFSPGFPHNPLILIHGIRSIFPFIAIIFAVIILLKKQSLPKSFFLTPLGLLSIYTIIGIISSVFSNNPLEALYWAVLYGSVIVVLLAIIDSSNPLKRLSLIININWLIAGIIVLVLTAVFLVQPGIISSLSNNFLICGSRPYEGLGGVTTGIKTLGMAGTRPTGLGRYAGVIAIVCFFSLCFSKKRAKFFWLILFLFFSALLIFSRGRTEIAAFLFAIPLVLLLGRKYKYFFIFGTGLLIFLIGFAFFYQSVCSLPAKNKSSTAQETKSATAQATKSATAQETKSATAQETKSTETKANPIAFLIRGTNLLTLSGRTNGVWLDSWRLFLINPLVGYGFQADRFFLNGQHTHNSILHALVQTGILGTIPFVLAFILTLIILWRLFRNQKIQEKERNFLITLTAVFVFFAVRSITESVAFFSADWLFVAPIIAYIQCLNNNLNCKENNCDKKVLDFLGNKINIITIEETVEKISGWLKNESHKFHWIIVTGMHGIVEAERHADFKYILSEADLFVPDGISLVWLAKLKGFNIKKRISGADLMSGFFKVASENGFSSYFYGDADETLQELDKKLLEEFPKLKIAGSYSPPFRELTEEEDKEIIEKINLAKPDVLWVGLGLPKQEKWIFKHRERLNVPVVIGVGAAFKFLSGKIKRAPKWIGDIGFEWLWRLFYEPKVTSKRVFVDIPIFLWLVIKDFFTQSKT